MNLNEPYQFCQEDWSDNQPELCQKLADGDPKLLVNVKLTNENLAKYYLACIHPSICISPKKSLKASDYHDSRAHDQ